ncbi:MAG TPA: hypothetical protein PLA18_08895 [Deltaproteobacteria bacterium]|jgi:BASS family bile acid:Na+ symporter|nr:hypothetical protein [Deltaproteobacteria bacterium]
MKFYYTTAVMFFSYLYVITAMAFIGVAVSGSEISSLLRDKRLMLKVLLANILLVPVLGLALVNILPMAEGIAAAVILLAAAPGGLNALQFTTKIKGELSFAAAVLFVLSVSSFVFTPIAAQALMKTGIHAAIPYGSIFMTAAGFVILPLAIGFSVHAYAPALGKAVARPLNLISTISFVIAILLSASVKKEALRVIGTDGLVAMLCLVIGSMVIGWLLGGPGKDEKRVLASTTSNRNAALCMIFALRGFPDESTALAILVFLLLAVPMNMIFTLYEMFRGRQHKHPPSYPAE